LATYQAVSAVGQAIVSLLEGAIHPTEFADAKFALFRTEDFEQPIESGVSIYLYRVAAVRMSRAPSKGAVGSRRKPPSLPLSLHYLLTPWGTDAVSEHRLLAWAMRVLEDTTLLSSELLNRASAGAFSQDEAVELILEDLALAEAIDLWQGVRHRYRLGVSYATRIIMIDSSGGTG
jgi:hypothetical protein